MKTVTASYLEKDEKETRLPVELFHFYDSNGTHWRYTSGDSTIVYNSETYLPATIKRGIIEYSEDIEAVKVNIQANYASQPSLQYMTTNPIATIYIQIVKLFRDQSPYSGSVLFTGIIKRTSFQGIESNIECTGFEHFFKKSIPRFMYQASCNWFLYSDFCTIDKDLFKLVTLLDTIDSTGLILTSSNFALYDNDYFSLGYFVFGAEKRMVVYHTGNTIKLRYPINGLETTDTITIYAGCNKVNTTCRDKFSNIINFGGHANVPIDNPALSGN